MPELRAFAKTTNLPPGVHLCQHLQVNELTIYRVFPLSSLGGGGGLYRQRRELIKSLPTR